MKLEDLNLMEIVPPFMRDDLTVKGLSVAADVILNRLYKAASKTNYLENLELYNDAKLDYIAKLLGMFWYKEQDATKSKIDMIRNSNFVFSKLGTAIAVESVISDMLQENAVLKEWSEYGGEPYHFVVVIDSNNIDISKEAIRMLGERITLVKNARSILDGYIFPMDINGVIVQSIGCSIKITVEIGMEETS